MNKLFSIAEIIRSQGSHRVVPTLATLNRTIINGKRFPELIKVLAKNFSGSTLIFTNTREQCDNLASLLQDAGHSCLVYRGEMDKVTRRNNLRAFRDGKIKVMISTDLAGRGLDVERVGRVINYHLPKELDNYLHRVGRTARAGRKGLVINFVTERDGGLVSHLGSLNPNAPAPTAATATVKVNESASRSTSASARKPKSRSHKSTTQRSSPFPN